MKMTKRLLRILLSLVMVLGLMPGMSMIVYADDTDTSRHREELTSDSYDWENKPSSLTDNENSTTVNNLFDNNADTKWYIFWNENDLQNEKLGISIKFHTKFPVVLKEYELWTGDAVSSGYWSRNPRAWKLEGSNSATGSWNVLDTKESGDYLPKNGKDKAVFAVHENTNRYQYYRLTVTEIGKENGKNPYSSNNSYYFELSEIKLFSFDHDFTYSPDVATITATCKKTDCPLSDRKVTLSIVAPTLTTYGETGKSAEATLNGLAAFNAATGLDVAATGIKYYRATKSDETYTKVGDALATAPTGAGDYVAELTLSGVKTASGDNGDVTASVGYTIAKANPTAPTGVTATYGQTLANVTLPDGWTWADSTQSVGNVVDPAATFKANFAGDDNHNAASNVDVTVTVGKANAVAATVTANNRTYDGTEKPLVTVAGETIGGTLKIAVTTVDQEPDDGAYTFDTTSIPTATDAGTYYVWYKVLGDDYHSDTAPVCVEASIQEKPEITVAVTFKVVNGAWDDGTREDKVVTLTGHEGDVLKLAQGQIPAVGNRPDDAYMAGGWDREPNTEAEISEDTAYTYTYGQKGSARISKAPEARSIAYSGQAQELVTAGTATGGTMYYALGNETAATEEYSTSIPKASVAGTYYVWYKVIGDDNHSDTTPVLIKVTISEDTEFDKADKVPVSESKDQYAAPEDNIAPISTTGKIMKLQLDFSRVKESRVSPSDLRMTAIKGSKLVTKDKVKDASSVKTSGGVKAKVNKKTLAVTITLKKSGTATFSMKDGSTYTVKFTVEQPKARDTAKYIPKKNEKVTLTTKDLFGTSIDAGELAIRKQKGKQAEIKDNALVIAPEKEDKIKVRYTYLNKKYNITVKVK